MIAAPGCEVDVVSILMWVVLIVVMFAMSGGGGYCWRRNRG